MNDIKEKIAKLHAHNIENAVCKNPLIELWHNITATLK